ncbi:unnamed protein product [Bursaphelenchus okinawaensis]|uniref:TIMELESS-interacting protein n=1 Tax=Bursaphelenchus okinawaensis TaxID=465554 RepID=A0A811JQY8_9BILA|nr:unnamed protein product [Bursaphelenchus okinawaensis]CAG9078307.1 unnamed protein product [Bursaphelenchus okinawaensis]
MDYDDDLGGYDEDDFMDVEEAIEVPEKKRKTDVTNLLDELAEGDEEGELKKGRVEPKVKKAGGTRLNFKEKDLTGPKGIRDLIKRFEGYKPPTGGKNPYADLEDVMLKMENWAHDLFPKMSFSDFLLKAEQLGRKRAVHTHMLKIRNGMEFGPEQDELIAPEFVEDNEENAEKKEKSKKKGKEYVPIHFC